MRILFLLTTLAALSSGCIDDNCTGKVIEVNAGYTSNNDGEVVADSCGDMVSSDPDVYDFQDCCPDGYTFLAMGLDDTTTVLCEQDCGFGSSSSVASTADAAFVAHAVVDAALDAVAELGPAAP